ncbi:MAG: energy-coupling factor transporter transmembrane component T [Methanobacteriaceae archaeon]|nr:energy-coupling factor transporter transmembrane component T [Methanobacteriaceae archaeon]
MINSEIFSPFKGEFDEGEISFFHKLDPRVKMGFVVGITLLCAFIQSNILLGLLVLLVIMMMILSNTLTKVGKFLLIFILFCALAIFLTFIITGNLLYAMKHFIPFFLRFFVMISTGLLFAFTTPPQKLAQSLEKMKVPTSVTFTLSIAIRYIPTLAREASAIFKALKLRGVKISTWDFIKKPGYIYRGMIIPLIIRSIKLSDEIAIAAESRGFCISNDRSSLNEVEFGMKDYRFILLIIFISSCFLILDASISFKF